jgi:hypothetical protein
MLPLPALSFPRISSASARGKRFRYVYSCENRCHFGVICSPDDRPRQAFDSVAGNDCRRTRRSAVIKDDLHPFDILLHIYHPFVELRNSVRYQLNHLIQEPCSMDITPPFSSLGIGIAINTGDNVSEPGHVSALDTS